MNAQPTDLQLDALREVANVGCGHAANALSQLVGGRKVQLDVPRVMVMPVADMSRLVGGPDARVVAAVLRMEGELGGQLLLILPDQDAHRLTSMLLNQPSTGELSEVERSAIGEVANIVASACLNAIAGLTGMRLLPSTPELVHDTAGIVMDEAFDKTESQTGLVVVLEARFFTSATPLIDGQMLVLPERSSLKKLLEKLGV
ncbi:MAG: chemotaxis protein CheC [Myxococcaceae bacterium]